MSLRTLVLLGAAALAACGTGDPPDPGRSAASPYEAIQVEENFMLPMRDEVRLATDVYRPGRDGAPVDERFPVLLHRTPYNKASGRLSEQARWFASHGYVVVVQDMRGLYFSEGMFQKYHEFDAPDGFDTVAWIVSLDYVSPSVGMWGTSYGAHTQADVAKLSPPGLETLVLTMGGLSDAWTHKVRNHGAFELGQQLGWAHSQLAAVTDEPSVRARLEAEGPADWFPNTPFRKGDNPLSAAPNFEDYYLEMQNHGDYDDYFRGIGRNWAEYYDRSSDIPMLHVGGWYDSYAPGTIQSFLELSRIKSAPMTLVMGPWTHGGNSRSYAGDIEFGETAAIEDFAREFHLRWFDARLKGQGDFAPFADDRLETPGAVTLFVMGGGDGRRDENGRLFHGGEWRTATTWPLVGTELTPFHLRAGGGLTPESPDDDEGASAYTYDPEHPVPTIGGAFSGALKRGGYDQRERTFLSLSGGSENGFFGSEVDGRRTADRSDVLVFETEPLPEDIEVIGPVSARLWVSSSAPDTDFTAKLVDVYPPSEDFPEGFDLNITDGILRARYRDSRESESQMTPGDIYELEITLFPTANRFGAGHRIRLEISSSNFPRFDPNPNTGEPLGRHTRTVPAENVIHHSEEHPSALLLPLQPSE
ncbi:MAG: CocE/NonD family hydrolase [Acidobacteria bacterium]|nr:CocE/NonD family hydrolase [Acidobacteriota bacterium]MYH20655.1 CocE/NonD family hydrolase [Acidobacteriota bacterium]MYK78806.1 CocE/NonD family hydrolase [Acidobacteriota bacterium]